MLKIGISIPLTASNFIMTVQIVRSHDFEIYMHFILSFKYLNILKSEDGSTAKICNLY